MTCNGVVEPPPTVTVVDTANGENVCNAQVTASNGSSTLRVTAQGNAEAGLSDASCAYEIEPTQDGTFTIQASAPGLHMTQAAPTLTIETGQCGRSVSTLAFTIPMSP